MNFSKFFRSYCGNFYMSFLCVWYKEQTMVQIRVYHKTILRRYLQLSPWAKRFVTIMSSVHQHERLPKTCFLIFIVNYYLVWKKMGFIIAWTCLSIPIRALQAWFLLAYLAAFCLLRWTRINDRDKVLPKLRQVSNFSHVCIISPCSGTVAHRWVVLYVVIILKWMLILQSLTCLQCINNSIVGYRMHINWLQNMPNSVVKSENATLPILNKYLCFLNKLL